MSPELILASILVVILLGGGFTLGVEFTLHTMRKRAKEEERKAGAAQ